MKLFALTLLTSALLTCSQAALATDLYRCGNSYQDTPCTGALNTKPISKNSDAKKATPANTTAKESQPQKEVDVDCKQRGDAAKKISWMREIGKTAEDQIATAPDSESQALVKDVYNHRGNSLQVKNAIEHECMQQKEKNRLAEKLMIEAERLRSGGSISTGSIAANKTQPKTAAQKEESVKNTQNRDDKLGACSSLKSGLDNIANKRRQGGNAGYMEDLKQQQNQLESAMKSAGC